MEKEKAPSKKAVEALLDPDKLEEDAMNYYLSGSSDGGNVPDIDVSDETQPIAETEQGN